MNVVWVWVALCMSGPTGTFTLLITSFAVPQFNEERREKKKQTQSLKLFEFFLNQMSMILTSGDGLILETAPPTTVHSQSIPHLLHAQHISFPSDN